jgi:regulator of PEP synthase PpsR (kinase-PPPase family)
MQPLVFHTVRSPAVARCSAARATHIDLLSGHLTELEAALGTTASEQLGSFHTVGDTEQYFARMRAVEYAIEHDDGQSMRALDQADVLIVAPSRAARRRRPCTWRCSTDCSWRTTR